MRIPARLFWMIPVITPLILSACDPRPKSQVDPEAFLNTLFEKEGPQVDGVDATLLNSAHQAEEKKEYGRAIQFYQQLLDSDKENPIYINGLADNLRRLGQFDEAASRYAALLSKQPDNVDAMEGRGLCLLSKGEFDAASDLFKKVLAKEPTRWRSLNAAGILFVMKEMPKEALSYYDQALKAKPDEPAVLNNVGLTMAMMQDYEHAIDALTRAGRKLLDTDQQKKRADLNLALVYGLSGDMERAEQVAGKHLRDSALNNNLGFYAYLADNKELAKAYLNNAVSGSAVFYEKAWKNLEVVAGSRVERSQMNATQGKGFSPRSARGKKTPFSVYAPEEAQPEKAASAPVMPVTAGQDLDALVLGNASPETPPQAAIAVPELPAALPPEAQPPVVATPAMPASPVVKPTADDSHVEIFPAVPVYPMMQGGIRPVSMPIMGGVEAGAVMPATMPQQVMPQQPQPMPVVQQPVMSIEKEKKTPKTSKILEKIRKAAKVDAPPQASTPTEEKNLLQEDMTLALPSEMGAGAQEAGDLKPARLKDPRAEMIIYQAKPAQQEAPEVPSAKEAPDEEEVAKEAAPKKKLKAKSQPEAAKPEEPAVEKVVEKPVEEAPIATPGAAEEHPVQRRSTIDYIKQIF